MAQQKLFTEEQVKNVLKERTFLIDKIIDAMFDTLTPIELPSDEEIEKKFTIGVAPQTSYPHMIEGAKWMKEQILNQTK